MKRACNGFLFRKCFVLGTPVILSPVLQDLADLSFGEYQINIVASDKVANNRSLPDFRDPKCKSMNEKIEDFE